VRDNDVPYHPLYDQGYQSIGCAPCTRPVEPGANSRSGRWWWEKDGPKECGRAQAPATAPAMATEGVPFVQLANPGSGDLLPTGDIVITGAAWDPAATSGSGIDRVELYLDPRENGGLFLGSVEPPANTFTLTIKVPNSANGGHTLTAYARSSVTGHEAVEQVPVNVGVAPTPTPRPSTNS